MVLRWKHFLTSTPGSSSSAATWVFFSSTFSWRPTRHKNRRSSIETAVWISCLFTAIDLPTNVQNIFKRDVTGHDTWGSGLNSQVEYYKKQSFGQASFESILVKMHSPMHMRVVNIIKKKKRWKNEGLPKPQALLIHRFFNCEKSANTVPSAAASSTTVRAAWSSWNATSFWTTGALELRSGSKSYIYMILLHIYIYIYMYIIYDINSMICRFTVWHLNYGIILNLYCLYMSISYDTVYWYSHCCYASLTSMPPSDRFIHFLAQK